MTFDHNFVYSFPLFCSLLGKEWRRKGEWIAKSCTNVMLFCSISIKQKHLLYAKLLSFLEWSNRDKKPHWQIIKKACMHYSSSDNKIEIKLSKRLSRKAWPLITVLLFILLFFSPLFLGGRRKGEDNN